MIVDACNTYAAIECRKVFTNLSLNYFSGDNICNIYNSALSHIKFMCGAYAFTPKLGMTHILKVRETSTDIFN